MVRASLACGTALEISGDARRYSPLPPSGASRWLNRADRRPRAVMAASQSVAAIGMPLAPTHRKSPSLTRRPFH